MKALLPFAVIGLLCGCATPRANTPSGWPEIVAHESKAKLKDALVLSLAGRGWIISSDSEFTLTVERHTDAVADILFTNMLTGQRPKNRIRFNFVPNGDSTRLVAVPLFVHAPGLSGGMVEEEMTTEGTYTRLQYLLDCVAADLEGRPHPPEPPPPPARKSPRDS